MPTQEEKIKFINAVDEVIGHDNPADWIYDEIAPLEEDGESEEVYEARVNDILDKVYIWWERMVEKLKADVEAGGDFTE